MAVYSAANEVELVRDSFGIGLHWKVRSPTLEARKEKTLEKVRKIRNEIKKRITKLIGDL